MRQNRIALVTVGTLRPLDIAFLEHWQSALFEVHHSGTIAYTPDAHGKSWTYTDDQLHQMIRPDAASAFTLAVVNAPLEQNYYSRRLADNLVVVSLFEIGDILSGANHRLEHFVLRAAYVHAIYRFLFAGRIPLTVERTLVHQETRGCLFDLNGNKADIVASMDPPLLCTACRTQFSKGQVPPALIPALDRELPRIRKDLFFRILQWVQSHPLLSLFITAGSALLINVLSNIIHDKLKALWPWIG